MDSTSLTWYVSNPHLKEMSTDHLYHLNIHESAADIKMKFSDVKFVCVGGSPGRMRQYAELIAIELPEYMPPNWKPENLTQSLDRYVMYKAGPVICASHGVGIPSMSVLLHELLKLLHYAEVNDVTLFRLGTSGGVGVEPGTVCITTEPLNGLLKPVHEQDILGQRIERPCILNAQLIADLYECQVPGINVVKGKTLCANDFYEGQGRLDGAICEYNKEQKAAFLDQLNKAGIKNIEMECTGFAAITHMVGVKAAVVCVTLLNRLENDQIEPNKQKLKEFEKSPIKVILQYIRRKLSATS